MATDEYTNAWLETYTGVPFKILDIDPRQINIVDIAQALSNQCRYNGHTREFFSVAEHCVHMTRYVRRMGGTPIEQLTTLLHDASEPYMGDMIRPLKHQMPLYRELEEKIHAAVATVYGTIYPHPAWLKDLDTRIIHDERYQAMSHSPNVWVTDGMKGLEVVLKFWPPAQAKASFMKDFVRLQALIGDPDVQPYAPRPNDFRF